MKTGTKKKSEKQNSTEQRKTNFKTLRNFQISRVFKRTNFDSNQLCSLMTLVMSFVTAEKNRNKSKQNTK